MLFWRRCKQRIAAPQPTAHRAVIMSPHRGHFSATHPSLIITTHPRANSPMPAIKGILFDKDGTLLNYNLTWLVPYRRAAAYLQGRFGARAEAGMLLERGGFIATTETWQADSVLASACNRDIIALWEGVIGAALAGADLRAIDEIFARPRHAPAVDNLKPLLAELRRGAALGIATMDTAAAAHALLRCIDAESLFDFVCGEDSGFALKPEPDMALAFCRAVNLRPADIAMVGDSPKDMNMGRAAGARLNVAVLTGAHRSADLTPLADVVLASIADLPAALARCGTGAPA